MLNAQLLSWQRLPIDHLYKRENRIANCKEILANTAVIGIMLIGRQWLLRVAARILSAVTMLMMTTARLELRLTFRRLSMLGTGAAYVYQACHIAKQQRCQH